VSRAHEVLAEAAEGLVLLERLRRRIDHYRDIDESTVQTLDRLLKVIEVVRCDRCKGHGRTCINTTCPDCGGRGRKLLAEELAAAKERDGR